MITFIVIIFAASIVYIIYSYNTRANATKALIYQNDKLIKEVSLTGVSKPYTIRIDYEGGYNILMVREGEIGVIEASCPDHLCVNMGFRDNSLLPITCLPNHLVIKIVKDKDHSKIDGVAY